MSNFYIEKDGEYKDYQYSIILQSLGHRCGYVKIPIYNRWHNVNYIDIPIETHGGLTYGRNYLAGHEGKDYWIGWDYAHYGDGKDFEACFKAFKDNKVAMIALKQNKKIEDMFPTEGYVYTTEEVEEDCKDVIEQLIKLEREENN